MARKMGVTSMSETIVETEQSIATSVPGAISAGRVLLSRVSARIEAGTSGPGRAQLRRAAYSEQYEIGIGAWKATIVKQVGIGKVRLRASFDAKEQETWTRRRKQRLMERLNARRRSAE